MLGPVLLTQLEAVASFLARKVSFHLKAVMPFAERKASEAQGLGCQLGTTTAVSLGHLADGCTARQYNTGQSMPNISMISLPYQGNVWLLECCGLSLALTVRDIGMGPHNIMGWITLSMSGDST